MKTATLRPLYVESFPKVLEDGVLYISRSFSTACHLCCCGCGTRIVTPIRPTEYRLADADGRVSLYPSVGNWNHSCQSHYVIRNGRVIEAEHMGREKIEEGRAQDEAEKRAYYARAKRPWHRRVCDWVEGLFH
jgi:hypothetical protein